MLLPSVFWGFQRVDNRKETGNDEESAGLLGNGITNETTNGGAYGATSPDDADENAETREARARMLKKIEESGNWWTYAKSFAVSFPRGCDYGSGGGGAFFSRLMSKFPS